MRLRATRPNAIFTATNNRCRAQTLYYNVTRAAVLRIPQTIRTDDSARAETGAARRDGEITNAIMY